MKLFGISIYLLLSLGCVESMDRTSGFKTLSDCSSVNRNEMEWSQFHDVAVITIDETSIISHLVVSSEEFCIASCHSNASCVAVQVNSTTDGSIKCQLLSYTPSTGKVRNETGTKLLFKGRRSVYNIDRDVNSQCDGFTDCYTLVVGGNVYLAMTDKHYANKSEARNACLNMPTSSGEFDLAILDSWAKITAVKSFISTIPDPTDVFLYTGGEAGLGVNDTANKWTRTGVPIDQTLWFSGEPNWAHEHCVMIAEIYNGLIDTPCSGDLGGHDINTLCEYFPE